MKDKMYYIQVIAGMICAFFLSQVLITVFFPMRSPFIRPNLTAYISNSTGDLFAQVGSLIPKFSLPTFTSSRLIEENSTTYAPEPPPVLTEIYTPQKSIVATGIRQQLGTQRLIQSTTGTYVTQNATSCLTVLKQKEVPWTEQNINVGGKMVKVRIPAGQPAPPVQVLEQIN